MLNNRALAASASAPKLYVEDVFSTYLYKGTGSTQTITNGIDLSGKGGLVWIKYRSGATLGATPHALYDTNRGINKVIKSSTIDPETTYSNTLTSFNASGFTLGTDSIYGEVNFAGDTNYASWTFRKAPKFFDVVTYTGTGAPSRTVNHNLGTTPGVVIFKKLDNNEDWTVWHRSLGTDQYLILNSTSSVQTFAGLGPAAGALGSSSITVGTYLNTENPFVAYLFAHNAGGFGDSGNDNVISCGSYTGNGSNNGPEINLGWEPQWVLTKGSGNNGSSWQIIDMLRGFTTGNDAALRPNTSATEVTADYLSPTASGFKVTTGSNTVNFSGETFIYIAIRRGPMKTPTAGTDVFYTELDPQSEFRESTSVPFPPDLVNTFSRNGTDRTLTYNLFQFCDRLRGLGIPSNTFSTPSDAPQLISSSTGAEDSFPNSSFVQLKADGRNITSGGSWNAAAYGNFIYYFFRRAPGFFDIVAYTGANGNPTINHNLGVTPELIITKTRSGSDQPNWFVASSYLPDGFTVNGGILNLNTSAASTSQGYFTSVTSSSLQLSNVVARSGQTYIAYLFATCLGVSKVGAYTGSGGSNAISVDCGFTNGARFVLIKRTDSTGDWYVWDTARGIVSGNDPYLLLNSTAAEVANEDYIDPYPAGFEISPSAPAALRGSSFTPGTFIYFAIA